MFQFVVVMLFVGWESMKCWIVDWLGLCQCGGEVGWQQFVCECMYFVESWWWFGIGYFEGGEDLGVVFVVQYVQFQ